MAALLEASLERNRNLVDVVTPTGPLRKPQRFSRNPPDSVR